MSVQQIKVKYCSLFPEIDFSSETGFCTFQDKKIATVTNQIKVAGTYKRLNKKGQTSGHTIQTHVKDRYELYIYHTESLDLSLLQTGDDVTITNDLGFEKIYTECSFTTETLPNEKYKTTISGFVLNEYNESCNISSDYILAKNTDDALQLVNYVECVVDKPSYYGISTFQDSGTKAQFILEYNDYNSNIEIGDYFYFHSNFDFKTMGLSAVKCISKSTSFIGFEGAVNYTTFTAQTNAHFTLNFEPAYLENVLVVPSALTTKIYTDFIPNFNTIVEAGGKTLEVAQGKELVTKKTVTDILTVPLILIDSELWKIQQLYKSDSVKFVAQSGTYYAFNLDNILTPKPNVNLFEVKEYELNLPYFQEVISRNH